MCGRAGNLPAAAVVAVAGCGGRFRSCEWDQRPYGHPLVTAGHRGHRPRVTSGSAMGRWGAEIIGARDRNLAVPGTDTEIRRRRGLPREARRREGRVEIPGSIRTTGSMQAGGLRYKARGRCSAAVSAALLAKILRIGRVGSLRGHEPLELLEEIEDQVHALAGTGF